MTVFESGEAVRGALRSLGDEIERRRVYGRIGIVGGAAMLLAYDGRQAGTADVDSIAVDPHTQVIEAAHDVARELGLPESWLDDRASVYGPRSPASRALESFSHPHLQVETVSAEQMLAMKVRSARPKDREDLAILVDALGIASIDEALTITTRIFPDEGPLQPRQLALLADVVAARNDRPGRPARS